MPKDNEVDEKVMPDSEARAPATLSWIQQRELIRAALCKELDTDIEDPEPTYTIAMRAANALHWRQKELEEWRAKANDHAATVAELRAEVERLRGINSSLVDKCNRLNLCGAQSDQRADAAERRVGELEKFMAAARRAIGDHHAPNDCYATGPLTGDAFLDLVQCPACAFLDQYANSTKVTP